MFKRKKKSEVPQTHVKTVEKIIEADDEIINIVNASIEKVPLEIYEVIKNLPEEVIKSDLYDQARKAILRVLHTMAKQNDELVSKMTTRVLKISQEKEKTVGQQIDELIGEKK